MKQNRKFAATRILTSFIAVIFGVITFFVGGQTLLGFSDPGYSIFLPLLIFNFLMGFLYAGTGFLIWMSHPQELKTARTIFLLNFFVFLMIGFLYLSSDKVAMESVIAMIFRTGLWLVIFIVIRLLNRKNKA